MRNEIIESSQTIFLKVPDTTSSFNRSGECVVLICPYSVAFKDVVLGETVQIQTWEVRLPNGEKTIARMITWLGKEQKCELQKEDIIL